ncbi:TPA: hypothetical protein JLJ93_000114 [Escherichia coli]|nr:hypothetical protein [Escherichia coli]
MRAFQVVVLPLCEFTRKDGSALSVVVTQPNHVASVVTSSTCDNDAVDIGGGSSMLTTALF